MKKITFLFLFFILHINSANAKITDTEKLVATCKVWGFLKYYHPKVANEQLNFDNELLNILHKIEKVQTKEEFSKLLENWIDDLGEVKKATPIVVPDNVEFFDKNFDLSWFDNILFSNKLSNKLKFIEQNRFQSDEEFGPNFNGFKNGKYANLDFNLKDSRILMLFAYWNLIEYYFPYKYKMDENWDYTLKLILPRVIEAKDHNDFCIEMKKMSTKLNDGHVQFAIYGSAGIGRKANYFPANGKIIDEKIVITEILGDSLAQAYNIKIGDVITKIDNKTIKELILENRELISASNEVWYLNKVVETLLKSYSETVKVEFFKDGKYQTKSMTWFNYHDSHRNEFKKGAIIAKEKFKLLHNNIGYVNMSVIKVRHIEAMIEALKSTKAIVFDMRNYPKETWKEISDFLNPETKSFCTYTMPYLNYPGRYVWSEGRKCGFKNKDNYKGKVIVLLNEKSISQSEWTAMCFKTAGNTTIIGSQTAGADGNTFEIDVNAFHTMYSGIGVYYPDRRETQRIGIVPDIEVKPTIKGIQEGKDEVLDRALAFIETGK